MLKKWGRFVDKPHGFLLLLVESGNKKSLIWQVNFVQAPNIRDRVRP